MWKYLLAFVIGYLAGCFSTADTVGRFRHVNIRKTGTGNPGASNVTFVLGWRMGLLVGFVDILKGILATFLTILISHGNLYLGLVAGSACILGHMFPFYLKFKGGKGFATLVGVLFGFDWKFALLAVLFIFLITLITDYIVLATLTTTVLFTLRAFLRTSLLALWIVLPVALIMFYKHRTNLYRIFVAKCGEKGFSLLFQKH
jgi:glycerol-3-phosphate acyltransferase PlsY